MLKRIDRYIISKFLGTYFFSLSLIILIGVVFDYNENVDKFNTYHAPWRAILFDYYLNFIPYYSNLFSALFVFLSVIFFTSKLAGGSEIIAIQSAGISFRRLMRPYLISAALISALSLYLSTEVIPRGSVKRLDFENTYKNKKKQKTYADNVQMQVEKGVIAYMEHFDGTTKRGLHFSLDRFEGKELVSHLTARSVEYDTLSDVRYRWRLTDVRIRDLVGMREKITSHARLDSVICIEPSDFLFSFKQQETLTSTQLRQFIDKQKSRGSDNLSDFEVEYHTRYASSFAAFIMATIGVSVAAKKRKRGMGIALGTGLGLIFAYIFLQKLSAAFSTNGNFPPILAAWTPNIIFSLIAYILYRKAPR